MVFCRFIGFHAKRNITNAKMAPIETKIMLIELIFMHLDDLKYAICYKGERTASKQHLRTENQNSNP